MNLFCFSFALNQKYRAANLLRLIVAKSVPKYTLSKAGSKSLLQHKIMRELRSYEEKGLSMQYHLINIEKLQNRMKKKFSNISYQIRWSVGDEFKIIISTKSDAAVNSLLKSIR